MSALARPRLRPLQTGQLATLAALVALAAVAWLLSDTRMAGMDAGPGTDPGTFGFYVVTWVGGNPDNYLFT